MWAYLTKRFNAFLGNITLTQNQVDDGVTKVAGVVSCLNNAYYGKSSQENFFYIGSWAKGTAIRPPRDVDIYFLVPPAVHERFSKYSGNKQSALLQEVKGHLLKSYPNSDVKGDGPVVLASFASYSVEIVPAFALVDDRAYWICDTKNGGSYITAKPLHEVDDIAAADKRNAGNVRPLIRMMKTWQSNCSVPLKSFYLELLAIKFLDQYEYRDRSVFYYDWMCRDFFKFLVENANGIVMTPGAYQWLSIGDAWKTKAESAYGRACKACDYEKADDMIQAGDEWQKIFGSDMPRSP